MLKKYLNLFIKEKYYKQILEMLIKQYKHYNQEYLN